MSRALVLLCSLVASACFPGPKPDGDFEPGTSGIDDFGSDDSPYSTSTDATSTTLDRADETTGDATSGDATTTEGSTSMSEASSEAGGDSSEVGEPGALPPGYPVDQAFGDDVRELDLIGRWSMPWNPAGQAHVVIEIADDGSFEWFERAADCSEIGSAHGNLWVEGTQLALDIEAWDKTPAWDTAEAIGVDFEAPYRMRIGYTPMGGYLGLAGPSGLLAIAPWEGRSYARIDASTGAGGVWAAESELWATAPGDASPALIVRDRFDAQLTITSGAVLVHARSWWYPEGPSAAEDDQTNGPWTDDTPGNVAGAATIAGVMHAYDSVGLISFAADRSFKLGAPSPCP